MWLWSQSWPPTTMTDPGEDVSLTALELQALSELDRYGVHSFKHWYLLIISGYNIS